MEMAGPLFLSQWGRVMLRACWWGKIVFFEELLVAAERVIIIRVGLFLGFALCPSFPLCSKSPFLLLTFFEF